MSCLKMEMMTGAVDICEDGEILLFVNRVGA